eukprot:CAMPEP_0116862610 /NCGR_PEP_ID=MMETSP0418-20121206/23736_1 /TAXON_ID=1158023 /ORGANISM="Astrosyne radiata, Strain 13vi08-1A" /LENGTH=145 /DNA_ID=CAMNT_0004497487 /DNA_START=331 /DNA_END=768 /DNA_ORIENTATION=+
MVALLRERFGDLAVVLYNELTPQMVALLWRPKRFVAQPFRAMNSEFARPICDYDWKNDTMVMDNMKDVMREVRACVDNMVTDIKVLQNKAIERETPKTQRPVSDRKLKRTDAEGNVVGGDDLSGDDTTTDDDDSDSAGASSSDWS